MIPGLPLILLAGALLAACAPGREAIPGDAPDGAVVSAARQEPGTGTLVVLNKAANTAALVDLATGEVYATLPTGAGPHEVAVSADGRTAVVADYGGQTPGNTLTVLDLEGRKVVKTIDLGEHRRPHGIVWLPGGNRVAVTSEASESLLLVDVEAGRVVSALPTGQSLSHMVAITPDGKRAFTANIRSGSITALDLEEDATLRSVPTGAGAEGIDVTPDGTEVWVTNRDANTVTVLDASTLETKATIPSATVPIRVKITPDGKHALVSNAMSGELRIFDVAGRQEVAVVPLAADTGASPVPVGVLVAPDGKRAYVALMQGNAVAVVDLEAREVVGRIRPGEGPDGMAWSPLRGR